MRLVLPVLLAVQVVITAIQYGPAQPGDRYDEYFYPIVTNRYVTNQFTGVVSTNTSTNFGGGWTNLTRRLELVWTGREGSNYAVESSVSLEVWPHPPGSTNEGWRGDSWRPCSLVLSNVTGWTSGVPHETAFFRLREL